MFIGQYKYNLDEKNRIIIPADYRKELGTRVIVNMGFESCITIYPMNVWNEFVEKESSSYTYMDEDIREYNRVYMSSAFEKQFDSQGRISLDEVLRDCAKLTSNNKACVVIGANKVIEIWSQEEWNKIEANRATLLKELSERMAKKKQTNAAF